jgi:ribosomal protein S18 acetylase RimI-like enzyme
VLEHTGRATTGICQNAVVRSVLQRGLGARQLPRIGLSTAVEAARPRAAVERRRSARYVCPRRFPVMASAACPIFYREWLHVGVTQIGAGGMTITTSSTHDVHLPGLELVFVVMFPVTGSHQVRGRVVSVRRTRAGRIAAGIAWADPPDELLHALSEYLLLCHPGLTPARLRLGGLRVGSIERAVTYGYTCGPDDHAQVLGLRLRAHQAEQRLQNIQPDALSSTYDAHSRHLACRFGRRIVGYYRVNFVAGDRSRSQYVVDGGHVVPGWLWEAGFVEVGAAAVDPEFQRCGLCSALLLHTVRVGIQAGYRHIVAAVNDDLLQMYRRSGFEIIETRTVEPKPGWRFRSHLIWLAVDQLREHPAPGSAGERMAAILAFAAGAAQAGSPR